MSYEPPAPEPAPGGGDLLALRERVLAEVRKVVVGQEATLDALLLAVSVGGHVLLEGVPGVAKTLLASALARALGVDFRRAQFTPDMLPSDLTGTLTLRAGELAFRPGPVFTNVLLADEINRTPPKTQAALLEAMQEGQVTVDGESHPLPDPFLVVATQNPIEYEGTYPLPEAQLDRFLMKVDVGYPSEAGSSPCSARAPRHRAQHARRRAAGRRRARAACRAARWSTPRVTPRSRPTCRASCGPHGSCPSVAVGASPRAAVHLLAVSKAAARLAGRDFVTPDDVAAVVAPALRHRLVLRPEAELERFRPDDAVANAVQLVPVPR